MQGQSQTLVNQCWVSNFANPALIDWSSTVRDEADNVYTTGNTFDATLNKTFLYVTKHDKNGNLKWKRQYSFPGAKENYGVAIIANTANTYVAGTFRNPDTDNLDYVILKYASFTGYLAWTTTYDGGVGGEDIPTGLIAARCL